ncbi:toxin-antitoxin system YwqK family antitoxin [Chryseobacterium herbae]|uniref:MORN repeat protein n=1 Tax=Chryseobacterium herbae TaxID=2976476 RepID=A0ABT2IQL6_9FLAO|nr:hypothetical protein [Chryseobacterium sp. pc1-10]MCT2561114.1 hypothetical protein [Chryseobacterium sp. pc1-10]
MIYKTIKTIIILFTILFLISCKTNKQNKTLPLLKGSVQVLIDRNYRYDSDFPPKIKIENNGFGTGLVEERFVEGSVRFGKTGIDNSKEGKWLSGHADFDKDGNVFAQGKIWREEYFKNGLREGPYKYFNDKGTVIYETTFDKGTGLWKEFHPNGQLYFEIYTKNGYFTDTLKLHDYNGKIIGKRLYKKDSLIYSEGLPGFPYRPNSVPSD